MTMRAWRLPEGDYLLEGAPERLPAGVLGAMPLPDGRETSTASRYYQVAPAGRVTRVFGPPFSSSVEDVLYVGPVHAVIDDVLVEFHWKDVFSRDRPDIFGTTVVLGGLVVVAAGDLPFEPGPIIAAAGEQF